ncbi:MAG: UDP-3-O-acyl-N-acetylglucosamine deacetylase [Verrucomicrobiia bacterium]
MKSERKRPASHFLLFTSYLLRSVLDAAANMAELQKTLGKTVAIKGLALHTGHAVTLTLRPAAENSGFIFKRMDLKDEPVIHAHVDHVKQVERATTIAEGNVKVHTVEHVLSAFARFGCGQCDD